MSKIVRDLAMASSVFAMTAFAVVLASSAPAHALKASAALDAAGGALTKGYQTAPALMLGLGLAAALSLLTFVALAMRPASLPIKATRHLKSDPNEFFEAAVAEPTEIAPLPFLEIEGAAAGARYTILRDMLRIGREEDNDIRIPNAAIQRYHAAIHREDYDDWHITALSGSKGLIVNGRRCSEALLHDGDIIQLGPGRMRFRAGHA